MRKMALVGVVAVASVLALAALPADAFHEAAWRAFGTAKEGPAMPLGITVNYNAEVSWLGQGSGTITVILRDPETNVQVWKHTFRGFDSWPDNGVRFDGCIEYVEPYTLQSAQTGILLLNGVMRNNLCTGMADDDFAGNYFHDWFFLDVEVHGSPFR